jgi:hypothetical protein
MSRNELAALLADLIRAKALTRAEADRVLARFDADEPFDLAPVPESDNDDWLAALALVLLLVRGNARRRLPIQRRERARSLLRGRFDTLAATLAGGVAAGTIPVQVWQANMQTALAGYTRQMAVAGTGRLPALATRGAIDEQLAGQWPFLSRFALTIAARLDVDRPLSQAQIAARSRSYGAAGWGAFFLAQGEGAGAGMVEQWISRDDRRTCRLCAPRHLQYYLPATGPQPGWDCLGRCRCVRVAMFAPDIYAELTGQPTRRAA